MFARKNTKVTLTLFCLVVALGLATVSEANSLVHNSRDHVDLSRRMVKKPRLDDPFSALFPVNGAEGASASVSTDTSTATTTAATDTSSVADPLSTGLSLGGLSTTSAVTDTATSTSLVSIVIGLSLGHGADTHPIYLDLDDRYLLDGHVYFELDHHLVFFVHDEHLHHHLVYPYHHVDVVD